MRFHSFCRITTVTWITHSKKTITRYNDSKAKVPRNEFLEVNVGGCVIVMRFLDVLVHHSYMILIEPASNASVPFTVVILTLSSVSDNCFNPALCVGALLEDKIMPLSPHVFPLIRTSVTKLLNTALAEIPWVRIKPDVDVVRVPEL